jgi:hypothetical protein
MSWQLYNNEKNGLQQFQTESFQPIKRFKDKKKKIKHRRNNTIFFFTAENFIIE